MAPSFPASTTGSEHHIAPPRPTVTPPAPARPLQARLEAEEQARLEEEERARAEAEEWARKAAEM